MRRPTSEEDLYRWHSNALLGPFGEDLPITEEPQCGWYKLKLRKFGPYVPARVWCQQDVSPAGELLGDEVLHCEVNGQPADLDQYWTVLIHNPITESEFNYMNALRRHAEQHEPGQPEANPHKPIDWTTIKLEVSNRSKTNEA